MNKPRFNPNEPFEVVGDSKPAFNPNQPFEVIDETPQEAGIYEKYVKPVLQPTVEGLGSIGGGMAGFASPIPGGTLIGAGLGYAGAKRGYEAVEQMLGHGQPKPLGQNLLEMPQDITTGALQEATGQTLNTALPYLAKQIPQLFNKLPFVQKLAFSASHPTKGEIKGLPYMGQSPEKLGGKALEKKVVSASSEKMLNNVRRERDLAGEGIDKALTSIDKTISEPLAITKVEAMNSLYDIKAKLVSTPEGAMAYTPQDLSVLDHAIETLSNHKGSTISYKDFNKYITGLSKRIKNFGIEAQGSKAILREGRSALKNFMNSKLENVGQQLESLGETNAAQNLLKGKEDHAAMSTLEDILEDTVAGEQARKYIKPLDVGIGSGLGYGAYHMFHNPEYAAMAAAVPFAVRGVNKYAPSMIANMGNNMGSMLGSPITEASLRTLPYIYPQGGQ